jgi:hypothetical protein
MVPSVMWFVIGGFPQTAALQKVMTEPVAWNAVVALSMIAQAWLAWRVVHGLRTLPMLGRSPWSDDVALFTLRVACGVGSVGLGGHALMRALSGVSPNSSLLDFADHTQAYASGTPATGMQLANGAAWAIPPGFALEPGQQGTGAHGYKLPLGVVAVDPDASSAAAVPPSPAGAARPPSPGNRAPTLDEAMAADVANTKAGATAEPSDKLGLKEMEAWAADANAREADEAAARAADFAADQQADANAADARYAEANAAWKETVDRNAANDERLRTSDPHNAEDLEWLMNTDFSKSDGPAVQRSSEAATDAGIEAARADRAAESARGLAAESAARAAAARETAQATPWKPEP